MFHECIQNIKVARFFIETRFMYCTIQNICDKVSSWDFFTQTWLHHSATLL